MSRRLALDEATVHSAVWRNAKRRHRIKVLRKQVLHSAVIGVPRLRRRQLPEPQQKTNTVNLRCDSRLKASRSDAFNHSVT